MACYSTKFPRQFKKVVLWIQKIITIPSLPSASRPPLACRFAVARHRTRPCPPSRGNPSPGSQQTCLQARALSYRVGLSIGGIWNMSYWAVFVFSSFDIYIYHYLSNYLYACISACSSAYHMFLSFSVYMIWYLSLMSYSHRTNSMRKKSCFARGMTWLWLYDWKARY